MSFSLPTRRPLSVALSCLFVPAASVMFVPLAHAAGEELWKADVTVTASRIQRHNRETLASVTVIDRAMIERSQAGSLPELLARQAGVQFNRKGGRGADSSIFLRGTNAGHALVLVDGVRVGSATLGSTSLENYNLDQIERIEIVRGPRSSLYGSEAIGGVIQIFTRRAGTPARLAVAIGNNNTLQRSLTLSDASATTQQVASLSLEDTDGIDNSRDDDAISGGIYNHDDDGFSNRGAHYSVSHLLNDRIGVTALLLDNKGTTEYDPGSYGPDGDPYTRVHNSVASTSVNLDADDWQFKAMASRSDDRSETLSSMPSEINTTKNQGLLQASTCNDVVGGLVFGTEYINEAVDGTIIYDIDSRDTFSGFTQWQRNVGPVVLNLGARHDANDQYGSRKTGSAGVGLPLGAASQVYTTVGRAFKAPTINDLYWPRDDYSEGNPDLRPESSGSTEVGYKWLDETQSLDVAAYRTLVTDLIQWQPDSSFFYSPQNVDNATLKGLDAGYRLMMGAWSFDTQLSFLRATDDASDDRLILRPERSWSASVDRQLDQLTVGATLVTVGDRDDNAFDSMGSRYTVNLPGYATLDLRSGWQQSPEMQWNVRATNVLEKRYQPVNAYNAPGLGVLIGFVYTPQ
jgi:vitamin B12 transporter